MPTGYQPLLRLAALFVLIVGLIGGRAVLATDGNDSIARAELDAAFAAEASGAAAGPADDGLEVAPPEASANWDASPAPESPDAFSTYEMVSPDSASGETLYRVCRVTAYCDNGTTASGTQVGMGQCAAPSYIPFGSVIYIPALDRRFVVTDRTHRRFRRSTVDLYIPSKELCRRFGCQYLECEITLPAANNPD